MRDAFALWAVLVLLRGVWLGRRDGAGRPFATHFFDFWYKSAALEWLYWVPVALPALLAALAWRRTPVPRLASLTVRVFVFAAGLGVLVLSVVDMETMRFTGGHLTPSLVRTYARIGGVGETLAILRVDPGGPYLGLVLLAAAIVAWGYLGVVRSRSAARPAAAFPASAVVFSLLGVAAAAYVNARIGSFRGWRLAPATAMIAREWRAWAASEVPPARLAEARARHQREWYQGAGPQERARWVFPRPDYPLYRQTRESACAAGRGAALGLDCARDADGDQWSLDRDCDDGDARSYPGAPETTGDGVDQDCNGVDADPWNLILVVLESFRGASVGHLRPWGSQVEDATPVLDGLAREGTAYTRVWANGVPSAAAFMALHTGLPPHPSRIVARDFTNLAIDGFPRVLVEHGYQTRFFSTTTPEWDNFTFWLSGWGDTVVHELRQPSDEKMFTRLASWLTVERDPSRPFQATIWTRINHFPFHGFHHTGLVPQGLPVEERVRYTMRWTDARLGEFLDGIRQQPWFAHTLVIVTGDHGYPLGERGSFVLGENLYGEATWVPLVISGKHPKLRSLGAFDHRPASHLDLAPTLLDLLGVDAPNALAGHSLAGPAGDPSVVSFLWPEIAYARGDLRAFVSQPGAERPAGDELFSTDHDRLDRTRAGVPPAEAKAIAEAARARFDLFSWVYDQDRILPARPAAVPPGQVILE